MSLKDNVRNFGPRYGILLAISALATLGAILTLIPNPGASWPNILGYSSLCTFAPAATFSCALIAAVACILRARLVKKTAAPLFVPVGVLILLITAVSISSLGWAGEKAKYTDASSSASVSN